MFEDHDLEDIFSCIAAWYGEPRQRGGAVMVMLLTPSVEVIEEAAGLVAVGMSVGLGLRGHSVIPHEATRRVSNADFFRSSYGRLVATYGRPPTAAELWNERSGVLYDLGWREESLECNLLAIKFDPTLTDAWANLGRYFMDPDVRDYELAPLCLDRAIAINPNHDMALANRVGVAVAQNQLQLAVDLAERAIEANNDNFYAHYFYAVAHIELSKQAPEDCIRLIRVALRHLRRCQRLAHPPEANLSLHNLIHWCVKYLHGL